MEEPPHSSFPASHPPPFTGATGSLATRPVLSRCIVCCDAKCGECQQDPEYKLDRKAFWIRSLPSVLLPQPQPYHPTCYASASMPPLPQTQGGKAAPDCSPMSGHWENQVKTLSKSPLERREAFGDAERNLGPELPTGWVVLSVGHTWVETQRPRTLF